MEVAHDTSDLSGAVTFIQNRLVYVALPEDDPLPDDPGRIYLCSDKNLVYEQFFADFGPLNLACVVMFCRQLTALLNDPAHSEKLIVYYSSSHPHRRSNSAVLICCFAMIELKRNVIDAYAPFMGVSPAFAPFRDAAFATCTFPLTVLDCVRGVARAMSLGHFMPETFDVENYLYLDKIENGDVSWIVPGKFIAFSGPLAKRREIEPGMFTMNAEDYVALFSRLGVTAVVRFNKKCYDKRKFQSAGINHYDLYYEDGANPPREIMQRFLSLCEKEAGAIAVHCKAGLGRTGTNIAAYMMKHYGYTALEATAWLRICRPGSVVGPQQHFVQDAQAKLWMEGESMRRQQRRAAASAFGFSMSKSSFDGSLSMESRSSTLPSYGALPGWVGHHTTSGAASLSGGGSEDAEGLALHGLGPLAPVSPLTNPSIVGGPAVPFTRGGAAGPSSYLAGGGGGVGGNGLARGGQIKPGEPPPRALKPLDRLATGASSSTVKGATAMDGAAGGTLRAGISMPPIYGAGGHPGGVDSGSHASFRSEYASDDELTYDMSVAGASLDAWGKGGGMREVRSNSATPSLTPAASRGNSRAGGIRRGNSLSLAVGANGGAMPNGTFGPVADLGIEMGGMSVTGSRPNGSLFGGVGQRGPPPKSSRVLNGQSSPTRGVRGPFPQGEAAKSTG